MTLSVSITDKGGSQAATSATASSTDTAMALTSLTTPNFSEGVITDGFPVVTFSDANGSPDVNDFTATVTWNKGTSETLANANGSVVADGMAAVNSQTYAEAGSFLVAWFTDASGAPHITDSTTAATRGPSAADALAIHTFTPPSPKEHVSFTTTLVTFTDANTKPYGKDYTAVINWGDGSTSTATSANGGISGTSTFSVKGTHTYATFGNFTLSVQVIDDGGATASTSAVISVGQGSVFFGSQSIVVGGTSGGSVVNVAPTLPSADARNAPHLRLAAERKERQPAATRTANAPVLTQQQVTDLVFQMGLTGSPVGTSVHLTDAPGAYSTTQAAAYQTPQQVLLTLNQGMAASQNNALVARALRSATAKTQSSDSDDSEG